jgi:hypothetical protein
MFKPGMLNRYNFVNIIAAAMAGITGGIYLYTKYPFYFNRPVSTSLLYAFLFFMICFFAGRIKKSVWDRIDNKWLYIIESMVFLGLPIYFMMHGFNNYWNMAGILLVGYLIIYTSSTIRENIIKIEIIILSPIYYYGMIFLISFFTETIFAVSFLLLIDKIINKNTIDHYFIMSAIVLAFLVYINPFLILLLIVFCAYRFKYILKRCVLFVIVSCVSYYFMITLLNNHIAVLSLSLNHISPGIVLLLLGLLILAIYLGWICRNIYEVFFSSSILLFITILIYDSSLQIPHATLLSVIYPLFIFSIRDHNSREYLGLILEDRL